MLRDRDWIYCVTDLMSNNLIFPSLVMSPGPGLPVISTGPQLSHFLLRSYIIIPHSQIEILRIQVGFDTT